MNNKIRIVINFEMHSCICDGSDATSIFPTTNLPSLSGGMSALTEGYTGIAFKKCDLTFTDKEDEQEWQTYINSGEVFFIVDCDIDGGHTEEATTRTTGCIQVEKPKSFKRTFTLNIRNDNDGIRWAKLEELRANQSKYEIALIDCDGTINDFFMPLSFTALYSKGANDSEESLYTITIVANANIGAFKKLEIKTNDILSLNPIPTPPITPE